MSSNRHGNAIDCPIVAFRSANERHPRGAKGRLSGSRLCLESKTFEALASSLLATNTLRGRASFDWHSRLSLERGDTLPTVPLSPFAPRMSATFAERKATLVARTILSDGFRLAKHSHQVFTQNLADTLLRIASIE